VSQAPDNYPSWEELFAGELEESQERAVLERSANALEDFISSDSNADGQLFAVMEQRLPATPDTGTFGPFFDSLEALVGVDAANLVHWYVTNWPESPQRLEQTQASLQVTTVLRRATAAHGFEWKQAFGTYREFPDDWKAINREIYFDVIGKRYRVKHTIEKYVGESVTLDGNADSVLDLARNLIVSLRWLPTAAAFSERITDAFVSEAEEFLRMLQEEPEPAGPELAGEMRAAERPPVTER